MTLLPDASRDVLNRLPVIQQDFQQLSALQARQFYLRLDEIHRASYSPEVSLHISLTATALCLGLLGRLRGCCCNRLKLQGIIHVGIQLIDLGCQSLYLLFVLRQRFAVTGFLYYSLEISRHDACTDKQLFKVGIHVVVSPRIGTASDKQHPRSREYDVTQQLLFISTRLSQRCLFLLDGCLIKFYDVEQTCRTFRLTVTGQREHLVGPPVKEIVLVLVERRHLLIPGDGLLDDLRALGAHKLVVALILVFHL